VLHRAHAAIVKNAMSWRLQLELFRDLGLQPTDTVALPYPNVTPGG
jgi:hypothetical protein